jgi:PGF-CTERM protein
MRTKAILLTALVAVAAVATPAAAVTLEPTDTHINADATATTDGDAYSGTHVAYDVESDAVVDYTVNGTTVFESMAVESASAYESRTGASGATELGTVVELDGLALDVATSSNAKATVETSGAAEIVTHDNEDGTFVLTAGGEEQYVEAELGGDADATAESDDRVVVETGNGTTGSFVVVGDGEVTVNEEGHVSADLGEDARLVYRDAGEERSEDEESVERMIANGTATAEVYVEQQDGETVRDTVTYGQNTTVETSTEAENTVNVTVDRAKSQGKVVVTHVSETAVDATDSFDVAVDGEAAAEAESKSALEAAANGDDGSKYYVAEDASATAEGSATVLVAFDHFSERTASISGEETTSGDDTDGEGGDDGSSGDGSGSTPGFGVSAALLALVGAALLARRGGE